MYSTAVVNTELSRNFNGEVTLDELAERVREAHAATQTIVANALAAIFAAGEALIAARARIAEGGGQHWLRTCCSIPLSTAKLSSRSPSTAPKSKPHSRRTPASRCVRRDC